MNSKKWISLFLAVIMLLSLFQPFASSAYAAHEETAEAEEAQIVETAEQEPEP